MQIREQVPLATRTTIRIGGPARYLLEATSVDSAIQAIRWARQQDLPLLILGGGSNVLLPDEGFAGLVLVPHMLGVELKEDGAFTHVSVGAGVVWDDLVTDMVARNLAGLECLSGIPGKVGAAPIQNIGAYGQDLAETLTWVKVLDLENLEVETLTAAQCEFRYRDSIFKGAARGRYLVLGIGLKLRRDGKPTIRYPDLERRLEGNESLQHVRDTVIAVRREKSMVADVADPNSWSCGSFFTNPILDQAHYQDFLQKEPGQHPNFPTNEGLTKLAAAWLIERSGFHKGYRMGNVGLSEKHCLAIINRGGGTAAEIMQLVAMIQKGVVERFGVHLEPEPVIL